ncbi:hypothetical protein RHMOL_Rhmol13G0305500 [Rhododendron molle]|uniref:Uncharacterized protein n=1 Tax=Rhododendron molle TaxID=49168 RepID=A0ACC0LCB2_RHOML|nr:hypothetical protein RHMOL_Rhmol13G0305500 [Rhododendron molle]
MRVAATKKLSRALHNYLAPSSSLSLSLTTTSSPSPTIARRTLTTPRQSQPLIQSLLVSPWSATQLRGAKYRGSDVKPGNVIERKGKIYQVVKAQHTVQGRGGACIQVELRDVDSGNKVNERLRTDEAVEKVFVEEKPYKYLYTEDDFVVLTDPKTYDQLDVPKDLFGEAAVYLKELGFRMLLDKTLLINCPIVHAIRAPCFVMMSWIFCLPLHVRVKVRTVLKAKYMRRYKELLVTGSIKSIDDMTVTVQLYDGKPMSASVPQRVTCEVVEAQVPMKGIAATPHYKKVLLDNGLSVQVPAHVLAGDQVVINTLDNSYITRNVNFSLLGHTAANESSRALKWSRSNGTIRFQIKSRVALLITIIVPCLVMADQEDRLA